MKHRLNQLLNAAIIVAFLVIFLNGCAAESASSNTPDVIASQTRQQLLDAQMVSITSIENEIAHIRAGNSGDMSKWTPDTIALYKGWQTELESRYQDRQLLIKQLSGDSLGTPATGEFYKK